MDAYEAAADYLMEKYSKIDFSNIHSTTAVDKIFKEFQTMYSSDRLREKQKNEIFDYMFSNSGSMMSKLNSRKDGIIYSALGHLSQFANNLPFYGTNKKIILGRGMPDAGQEISKGTANEISYTLARKLAECVDYLSSHKMDTIDDYHSFEEFATGQLGNLSGTIWVHKYLHMMFPYVFTEFHDRAYRTKALRLLNIEPDDSTFGTDWQFAEIQKHTGLEHPFSFANAVYKIDDLKKAINGNSKKSIIPTIKPGIYGDWQVQNSETVLLRHSLEDMGVNTVPVPCEVEEFFKAEGLEDERRIKLIVNREEYYSYLQQGDNGMELAFTDGTDEQIRSFCQEHESDAAVSFSKERKNVYKVVFYELPTSEPQIPDLLEEQITHAASLSDSRLSKIATKRSHAVHEDRVITTTQRYRDPYIAENAKRRAGGVCQLREQPAPFTDLDGKPYLESHHIVFLSEGGEDSVENTAALCPNCHKKVHILKDPNDTEILLNKSRLLK